MSSSNEIYLNSNIRHILNPLLSSVLRVKPENPIHFMIAWLKEYSKFIDKGLKCSLVENNSSNHTKINSIFDNKKTEIENFRDELLLFKESESKKKNK